MNKRSNFTRTALLSALVCGIAGPSFVGCKDYDDDINALQEQVNTLNTGLEDLKKLVESGKSITDVTPITGGFKITFSDNTSYEIVNGKEGQQGQEGQPGKAGSVVTVLSEDSGFGGEMAAPVFAAIADAVVSLSR